MLKISGTAVCGVLTYVLLKTYKPEYAPLCELVTVVLIFLLTADELIEVKAFFSGMFVNAGIASEYITVLLKALGSALITQFAADTAKDAGENALASKIEFAGRVVILYCSLPLLKGVAQLITELSAQM